MARYAAAILLCNIRYPSLTDDDVIPLPFYRRRRGRCGDVDDVGQPMSTTSVWRGIMYVEFLFRNSFFLWQSYAGVDVDT